MLFSRTCRCPLVFFSILLLTLCSLSAAGDEDDEKRPSCCYYFDWINSQYEGSTESQTLANLEFFRWMHDQYGMILDVYLLDVGNIDDGPYTAGVGRFIPDHHGSLESLSFRRQFPRGFRPLVEKARSFGCRLGIWLGPDGFGDTPEQEKIRTDFLVSLCRDLNFAMFKFDAVAGGLRKEKRAAFARAIALCRKHCPDMIVLNERVDLGEAASSVTTDLWEGAETYIDVFNWNHCTAPHHRAGALARPSTPGLTRRLEDHGVCLSSCLDFWEDDLVLQAFNRALILAPEMYGSPWLLGDHEFPGLARLCNLHRRYRNILVEGMVLPEATCGPHAVSRGNETTRFITVRNLTWQPITYTLKLDSTIGLAADGKVELRRFHPAERILGRFEAGAEAGIAVAPFRACLVAASAGLPEEVGVTGCDYHVMRDVPGRPVEIALTGLPGTTAAIALAPGKRVFRGARLDGKPCPDLVTGRGISVAFPGQALEKPWHRKIGDLAKCSVPPDAEALYEATCFAADSNALEVRSLHRSGPTRIPEVQKARDVFFEQPMFVRRGIRDSNLFDGNEDTFFQARRQDGVLRLDLGKPTTLDCLIIRSRCRYERYINRELHGFKEKNRAEVSSDLRTWTRVGAWRGKGSAAVARMPAGRAVRYVRVFGAPARVAEIEGYYRGKSVDRSGWRASNLLGAYDKRPAVSAWSLTFILDEITRTSYLALALSGRHGNEGAYAALRVDGRIVGAPDRSVSYPSNTWEYQNVDRDHDYTYYFPLTEAMEGKTIEAVVLVLKGGRDEFKPELYLTAHPPPVETRTLELQ